MEVDDAVRAAYDALVGRPADLLPLYLVGAGAVQVARVSVLAAGAAAYLLLARDGRVAAFREELRGRELHPDATVPGEAVEGLSTEQLADLVTTHLADPEAIAVFGLGLVGLAVLQLVATAVANAGKLHAVRVCLADERGAVRAGAAGLRDDGPTMVAVAVLRVVAVVAVFAAVQVAAFAGGPVVGTLAALLAVVPLVGIYLAFLFAPQAVVVDGAGPVGAARASLQFVADEPATTLLYGVVAATVVGVVGVAALLFVVLSVTQLTGLVVWFLALPVLDLVKTGIYVDRGGDAAGAGDAPEAGGRGDVADRDASTDDDGADEDDGLWGGIGGGAGDEGGDDDATDGDSTGEDATDDDLWGGVETGRAGALVPDGGDAPSQDRPTAEEVTEDGGPADGHRRHWNESDTPAGANGPSTSADPDASVDPTPLTRLRAATRRGLAEMAAFVRESPALVAIAAALFAAGGAAGWRVTAPFEFAVVRTTPVAATFGAFPLDVFVALAANNWSVAATTSFAGLAAGVPTVAALLFNGVVVGAVAGLGYDPLLLTALVAPHGVLEFPALAVSGALGLHLGGAGWRFARGRSTADELASELRRALRVLVGLAPVFVAAAFVEAFLTPAIASLVAG